MPIYEYRVVNGQKGCKRCQVGIEIIQPVHDEPVTRCPQCGAPVARVFAAASFQLRDGKGSPVEAQIRDYERKGMYSHAAELADKEAKRTSREDLKTRALDNYKKAGYKDL
jgi:putative FmdB family regulatory protein